MKWAIRFGPTRISPLKVVHFVWPGHLGQLGQNVPLTKLLSQVPLLASVFCVQVQ